jgi:RNA polymerase sigma-70 factor (ECF subfamily)
MNEEHSFDDLLNRLRRGDDAASREVYERYRQRLIYLAQQRLAGALQNKVDPEDVLQSVYRSFFVRVAEGQFELEDWDGLWNLLVSITLHKCGHQVEYHYAARRDMRREAAGAGTDGASPLDWQALAREPTPDEAAMLTETVEYLLRGLPEERQQQILVLRLQGHSLVEISQQVGRSEQTVYRVLDQVKKRLNRYHESLAEPGV